jgi:hypothetical protein
MIVGARVEQRIVINHAESAGDRDDFEIKVATAGVVVACDRSGTPAEYIALVMKDDGTLVELPAKLLTVVVKKGKREDV